MTQQTKLNGRRIAVLATDGFEQSELTESKRLLEKAGANVDVIAPGGVTKIKGWNKKDWGTAVTVDVPLDQARAKDYDALVLPGGVVNPDKLRMEPKAIAFIKAFDGAQKTIAAISHGPAALIDAGLVKNRKMTSLPALRADLQNAGAHWQDAEVVQDGKLITSRMPEDIPAFTNVLIAALAN